MVRQGRHGSDQVGQRGGNVRLRGCGHRLPVQDSPLAIHQGGAHLRAADVCRQHGLRRHVGALMADSLASSARPIVPLPGPERDRGEPPGGVGHSQKGRLHRSRR